MRMTPQHTLFLLMKQKHAIWYPLEPGFISFPACVCTHFRCVSEKLLHVCLLMQPLPAKLVSRKKRAKDGRSSDEVEHFPIPSRVTVRRRSAVAAVELRDPEVWPWSYILKIKLALLDLCYWIPLIWLCFQVYSNSKGSSSNSKRGGLDVEDGLGRPQKVSRHNDIDQYSGGEDEMSDWFSSNPNAAASKWQIAFVLLLC